MKEKNFIILLSLVLVVKPDSWLTISFLSEFIFWPKTGLSSELAFPKSEKSWANNPFLLKYLLCKSLILEESSTAEANSVLKFFWINFKQTKTLKVYRIKFGKIK